MASFSIESHAESVKNLLHGFISMFDYQKSVNSEANPYEVADKYLKNEIDMERGMREYFEYLKDVQRKNGRLFRAIKSVKGKAFYKNLCRLLEDAEYRSDHEPISLVNEPKGKLQLESYGREIKGWWCQSWAQGTEGDSWSGYVYVQLKENKFLKVPFEM